MDKAPAEKNFDDFIKGNDKLDLNALNNYGKGQNKGNANLI